MFMIPLLGAGFWLRVVVSRCGRLPSGNFANAKNRVKQKAPHRRGLHEIGLRARKVDSYLGRECTLMNYVTAKEKFEQVMNTSNNADIRTLAEGLRDLANAINNDINKVDRDVNKVDRDVQTVKNKVNSLR
jgi:hypothetical protein